MRVKFDLKTCQVVKSDFIINLSKIFNKIFLETCRLKKSQVLVFYDMNPIVFFRNLKVFPLTISFLVY